MPYKNRKDCLVPFTSRPRKIAPESIVAMSVYAGDRADWLELAIESILGQSYQNFLFLIVIDGPISSELRCSLVEQDRRCDKLVLLESEENQGLAASMNKAIETIEEYKPEFFFRMDSDDISEPERLAKQVAFFHANPDVSILGTALIEVDEQGKKVGRRIVPVIHEEIVRRLPKRCVMNHPTVAFRFHVFEQGFRYKSGLMNTQDYFMWVDLVTAGFKFANLPQPLLRFRRANDFFKRRGVGKSLNEFRARFYAMRKLKQCKPKNILYACLVLSVRMLPPALLKLVYRMERRLMHKGVPSP